MLVLGSYIMKEFFHRVSSKVSGAMGSPFSFIIAVLVVALWASSGPLFGFSDTWQLVINTSTTIVTFLMVFLIQNTQNRDSKAMQLKLDELIRSTSGARNEFVSLESLSDDELQALDSDFKVIGEKKNSHLLKDIHLRLEAEKARRHHSLSESIKNVVNHSQ